MCPSRPSLNTPQPVCGNEGTGEVREEMPSCNQSTCLPDTNTFLSLLSKLFSPCSARHVSNYSPAERRSRLPPTCDSWCSQVTQRLFPWKSGGEGLTGFTVRETHSDSAVLNQCCTKGTTVNYILCNITYLVVFAKSLLLLQLILATHPALVLWMTMTAQYIVLALISQRAQQ